MPRRRRPIHRAAAILTTPWPAEIQCPQPSSPWFSAHFGGALSWASADRTETRPFVASRSSNEPRSLSVFPTGQLTHLTIQDLDGDIAGSVAGLRCRGGTEIVWGPCPDDLCSVQATYLGCPLPRASERTRHWTDEIPGSPWADTAPEVHWSRFLRDIGDKKAGDPGAARESLRFSRAFVTELRATLANACRARRCGSIAREADAALAKYLRDRSPTYAHVSAHSADRWSYEWSWTVTGGGVPLGVSCVDMTESPSTLCYLDVDLSGEVRLTYGTDDREVALYASSDSKRAHPLGKIVYLETDQGKPTISIEGRVLDLRALVPTGK